MALYYTAYKTFADVVADYDSIKPVVSKNHTRADDVRPIGDRARKQERIIKIDNNCYALSDWDTPDQIFYWGHTKAPTPKETRDFAPILWRKRGGAEYVHIRNGVGQGAHNGRYSFINRHLPPRMDFIIDNGKQFVRYQGKRYFLPKGKYWWPTRVEYLNEQFNRGNQNIRREQYKTGRNAELVFKRDGDDWIIQNEHSLPKPPRQLVRKGVKARYATALKSLREYVFSIAPVIVSLDDGSYYRRHNWEQEMSMRAEFKQVVKEHYPEFDTDDRYFAMNSIPPELALQIITSYNDSLRMYLAYQFGIDSDICTMSNEEDVKRVKAQYNRWVNKLCGFTKVVG